MADGDFRVKFSRTYTEINPNQFTGPATWRLCVPDEQVCGDGDGDITLSAIIAKPGTPIILKKNAVIGSPDQVVVEFDISHLSDDTTRIMTPPQLIKSTILDRAIYVATQLPGNHLRVIVPNYEAIKSIAPMTAETIGDITMIGFDIMSLGNQNGTREQRGTKARTANTKITSPYNINMRTTSIDLSSQPPIVTTPGTNEATLSFNMQSLSPA